MGTIDTVLERLRAEYLEMPGLSLTAEQAQRFCGIERPVCDSVLHALVDDGFLCTRADGTYARTTNGERTWRSRPAIATAAIERLPQPS